MIEQYEKAGYRLFPVHKVDSNGVCSCPRGEACTSAGKHPAINGWPERATNDAEQLQLWFEGIYKNYNLGMLLGNGLVCLDLDIKTSSDKNGLDNLKALEEKLGKLPETKEQTTPTGGKHLVFKTSERLGRYICKDPESPWWGIDVLGEKSYIVVSPSVTENGRYNWTGIETRVFDIPKQWEMELQKLCTTSDQESRSRSGMTSYAKYHASLPKDSSAGNGLGCTQDDLDKMAAALSWLPSSGWGNNTWFKMLCAIKSVANDQRGLELAVEWSAAENDKGETSEQYSGPDDVAYHFSRINTDSTFDDAGEGSIFYHAAEFGSPNNGDAKHIHVSSDGEIHTEFKVVTVADTGKERSAEPVDDSMRGLVDEEFFTQYETQQLEPPACLVSNGKAGAAMIGVLGDIFRSIEAENPSPQPLLAAMASFPILSAMTDRCYVGSPALMNTRVNLMSVGVAPTGGGKDASLKGGQRILRAVNMKNHIGMEARSGSAYHQQTVEKPNLYHAQDEIGKWWEYTQGNASHANTIKTFFLKVFTSACDQGFVGVAYAPNSKQTNIEDVDYPHVNLYGVSTPSTLFESLKPSDLTDGMIGRMVLCQSYDRPEIRDDALNRDTVAWDAIMAFAEKLQDAKNQSGAPMTGYDSHTPITINITPSASKYLGDINRRVRSTTMAEFDQFGLADVWARWLELSNKVACLMAIARDPMKPEVTQLEAQYAAEIIDYSCSLWAAVLKPALGDSDEKKHKQKIVDYLTKHPTYTAKSRSENGGEITTEMTKGVLRNRLNMNTKTFDSAYKALLEGGIIVEDGKKCSLNAGHVIEVNR